MTSSVTLNTMAETAPDYEETLAGGDDPPKVDEKDILANWKRHAIKRKKKKAPRSMSPSRDRSDPSISERPDRPRRRGSRDGGMSLGAGLTRSELKEARAKQQEELQQIADSASPESSPNNPKDKLLESVNKAANKPATEVRLLDFQSLKLHGRENEIKELSSALGRTFLDDAPSEVVLILGGSGTGKTSLVHHAVKQYKERSFCVEGKFDQNDTNVSRPYAAFLEVFRDLNTQILAHKEKEQFIAKIRQALGSEAFRITSLIPSLTDVIGETEDDEDDHEMFRDRSSLKQIFRLAREMMRQICSAGYPVIIFLDDLQWGGKESLALFQNLANDPRLTNLLLIGTYRDEEIAPLSIMLEEIGDLKSTLIRLSALDDDAVNVMVADLIDMDEATTKKFSAIVYRKTGGNALFVCQFLDRMQEVGYLQFSNQLGRWGWDLVKIRSEVNANDEIHEILGDRIQFLPSTARIVLLRAAALGNKFDIDILIKTLGWDRSIDMNADKETDERAPASPVYMLALEKVSGKAELTTDMYLIAKVLVKLGFLQHLEGSIYRFAHDKIHFAAISQIPAGQVRDAIHWNNGQMLKRILDESEGDKGDLLFFAVVEQLNQGSSCVPDDEERLELAAMNLKASYKVKETSAFYPAAGYAKEGLFLLARVEHKWDFYQGLTTKLILVMAEMAMCCGQSKDCMSATQEIIKNSRNLEEKVPAYELRLKNLGQTGKFTEAVKEGLEVLNLLGEAFPKESNLALVAFQLAKSKTDGFGKTDDDFCDLDLMTDEKQKTIMKIMAATAFYAIRGNEKTQAFVPLLFFRMFQITSRYGLADESIVAFAGYGVLLASILKEYSEGFRFGRLSMELQSGLGHRNLARGSQMNYQFLHHLKEPLADTLEPLMEGFKAGMICDETADAVNALSAYCSHYLNVGLPLEPLKQEYKGYLALMLELERDRVWQVTIPYAQLIDNLMGKNQQPSVLSGEVMNLKMLMDKVKKAENLNAIRSIYAARLEAAYWFASYDMALRMIQHLKELKLGIGEALVFHYRREVFFTGMTYLALAKNTKNNRQYIWSARDCIGKMKTWAARGSPDCEDLLFIMHAELYSVVGRKSLEEIADAYQIAVTNARRVGSLQNLALATELAGSYHLATGDHATAQSFLDQAYEAYTEWNAYKKASHLEVLYPQMFSKMTVSKNRSRN